MSLSFNYLWEKRFEGRKLEAKRVKFVCFSRLRLFKNKLRKNFMKSGAILPILQYFFGIIDEK